MLRDTGNIRDRGANPVSSPDMHVEESRLPQKKGYINGCYTSNSATAFELTNVAQYTPWRQTAEPRLQVL